MVEVGILMGSTSDLDTMRNCEKYLEHFGVKFETKVLSAHRNPHEVMEYIKSSEENGVSVFITGAGMAAHLGGVVASHTTLPVLGVPLKGGMMDGLDALLSMVQMPAGVPVPTFAVGNAGARNAAVAAVQILALNNKVYKERLIEFKKSGSKL